MTPDFSQREGPFFGVATGYAWGLTRWDCSWWVEGQEWFTVGIGEKRAVGREILAPRHEGSMDGAEFWLQSAEMKTRGDWRADARLVFYRMKRRERSPGGAGWFYGRKGGKGAAGQGL